MYVCIFFTGTYLHKHSSPIMYIGICVYLNRNQISINLIFIVHIWIRIRLYFGNFYCIWIFPSKFSCYFNIICDTVCMHNTCMYHHQVHTPIYYSLNFIVNKKDWCCVYIRYIYLFCLYKTLLQNVGIYTIYSNIGVLIFYFFTQLYAICYTHTWTSYSLLLFEWHIREINNIILF